VPGASGCGGRAPPGVPRMPESADEAQLAPGGAVANAADAAAGPDRKRRRFVEEAATRVASASDERLHKPTTPKRRPPGLGRLYGPQHQPTPGADPGHGVHAARLDLREVRHEPPEELIHLLVGAADHDGAVSAIFGRLPRSGEMPLVARPAPPSSSLGSCPSARAAGFWVTPHSPEAHVLRRWPFRAIGGGPPDASACPRPGVHAGGQSHLGGASKFGRTVAFEPDF